MSTVITQVEIRYEQDVVYARQRARLIAELLGFDRNDQTRISTAVSEIARNAYQYAAGGQVEFLVKGRMPPYLIAITVRDRGPGIQDIDAILEGRFTSRTGMGLGILGARRLMDHFHLETQSGKGTTVFLGKAIPPSAPAFTPQAMARITEALAQTRPETPLEEIRLQNQELLRTLEELRQRGQELIQLNQELEDTNRGVVALYAELDEKAVQLSRANELKSQFLSNMSHELRTPLNSILALSRLLLDRTDGDLTDEQEKQAAFIHKGAEDLSTLVNDLLDLARIEAGKTVVHPRECSAAEIFSGLRGMLRPLLVSESLALVFEDPGGIPPLFTDDSKVSQILHNFLSNALKFTERGEIRVSARLSQDGRAVVFSVADTGIGIAPADQGRIFEEYTQVEEPQQRKPRGTGLGLSISKKLAEMLGGSVGVESRFGVGSTFFAVIPSQYTEPGEAAVSEATVAADSTRHPVLVIEDDPATHVLKVLIIDDEDVARYLLKSYLADTRCRVVEAADGPQGLRLAEAERPDVIVLDLLMPGMSGVEVLHRLKGNPSTRHIPVIITTAKILDEEERKALSAQALAILSKGALSREATLEMVGAALRKAAELLKEREVPPNG